LCRGMVSISRLPPPEHSAFHHHTTKQVQEFSPKAHSETAPGKAYEEDVLLFFVFPKLVFIGLFKNGPQTR
jgi:hypothetical protein